VSLFYFLGLFTICLFFKGVHEVASLSDTDFFLITPILSGVQEVAALSFTDFDFGPATCFFLNAGLISREPV